MKPRSRSCYRSRFPASRHLPPRALAAPRGWLLLMAMLALTAAVPALAADPPRDTGRHRPVVAVPAPEPRADSPDSARAVADGLWQAGFAAGPTDAGRLFRAGTASGMTAVWGVGGHPLFTASRFTTKVDPGTGFGLFASRRLGDSAWRLRVEVARATCDVAAEALQGQAGEVFRFDRLTFLTGALAAEARLTSSLSHPYCSLGMTVCRMTGDLDGRLDQTRLGAQAALGYRQRLGATYLGLEAQVRRIDMDIKEFRPTVVAGSQPELVYDPASSLWLMELRLSLSRAW